MIVRCAMLEKELCVFQEPSKGCPVAPMDPKIQARLQTLMDLCGNFLEEGV